MADRQHAAISRREFAKRAAMVSAAASMARSNLIAGDVATARSSPQSSTASKLLPESQVEVESRIQTIFAQYGNRLSDAQKADIRRLATEGQPPLDRLRAYITDNDDGPALYLRPLIEREKKPRAAPVASAAVPPPKKP